MQTEFTLLKKATLKNIEHIQETPNLQQTYTTSLCSHINTIYTKLAQLEKQIQTHCLYPRSQTDTVQINALVYALDIDGQIDVQPQTLSHVHNSQEESTPTFGNSKINSTLSQDSDRFEPQSEPDQSSADNLSHRNTETVSLQYEQSRTPHLDNIPELEEDWEDRQFADADLIDHHNTTSKSDRI